MDDKMKVCSLWQQVEQLLKAARELSMELDELEEGQAQFTACVFESELRKLSQTAEAWRIQRGQEYAREHRRTAEGDTNGNRSSL